MLEYGVSVHHSRFVMWPNIHWLTESMIQQNVHGFSSIVSISQFNTSQLSTSQFNTSQLSVFSKTIISILRGTKY